MLAGDSSSDLLCINELLQSSRSLLLFFYRLIPCKCALDLILVVEL